MSRKKNKTYKLELHPERPVLGPYTHLFRHNKEHHDVTHAYNMKQLVCFSKALCCTT